MKSIYFSGKFYADYRVYLLFFMLLSGIISCGTEKNKENSSEVKQLIEADADLPIKTYKHDSAVYKNMQLIPSGEFYLGAVENDTLALQREFPRQTVKVDSFYMDKHEVTNAQFREFVEATGYKTVAERDIDWETMKQDLPPGTPKPADSLLVPGSLVFTQPDQQVSLNNNFRWWSWVTGANWQHPAGPDSDIKEKDDYPVVHIAYEDAKAYAKWAGKRLPTEAEWTWAAKGGHKHYKYPWGNEHVSEGFDHANYWTGTFPSKNTEQDGFYGAAPVMSYPANDFGLYEMAGNVWEITSDKYNENYLKQIKTDLLKNPQGATMCYDPGNPYQQSRVMKGGSYLCNDSYCASYRISAKMAFPEDSGTNHIGFRCVKDVN